MPSTRYEIPLKNQDMSRWIKSLSPPSLHPHTLFVYPTNIHNQLTLCEHIKLRCTQTTDLCGNKRLSKTWLVAKYKLGNQMRVLISVSNAQVKPVFLKIQLHRSGFWNSFACTQAQTNKGNKRTKSDIQSLWGRNRQQQTLCTLALVQI